MPNHAARDQYQGEGEQFLHITRNVEAGDSVAPGAELGTIQNWEIDNKAPVDASFSPSHAHLAIYQCDEDGIQTATPLIAIDALEALGSVEYITYCRPR